MYSIKNKIVAILLVTVIALGNFACLGQGISYASDTNLESQNIATNNKNVEFDAYFSVNDKKTHTLTQNMLEKATLYLDIDIKNTGYLKEAIVNIDSNFKVEESFKQDEIQKIENNKIELKQINGNSEKVVIALPIYFDVNEKINIANFSRQNNITLNAIYIDDEGKEHNIEKTINTKINWTAEPEMNLESSIQKYVPYIIEDEKGIIIEQKVKIGIKDNVLPIAESNVEITVPEIENTLPKISIRKENENIFSQDKYNYNSNNGKLIIKETNTPSESGEIYWITNQEYIITYRYENIDKKEEIKFLSNVLANVKTYGGEVKTLSQKYENENILTETIGKNIEITSKIMNQNISKGYLYTNLENNKKLEIPYGMQYDIDIAYSKVADEIVIDLNKDTWKNGEENIVSNTYFEQIKIDKENFIDILGKEGYVTILSNGKEIAKITNSAEENITANIEENKLNEITLKTSKPQKEGRLTILASKIVKDELLNKEQIQTITDMQITANMKVNRNNQEVLQSETTALVKLIEPTSSINVEINKEQFSTVMEKEELEIKVTLKTNSEQYSLYKNPTIDIVLPKEMENIEIINAELLYEEELKIESAKLVDEANKVIRITLSGNQTKYSINQVAEGATIVLRANVTINNLTPTKKDKIQVLYTNQKTIQYEQLSQDGRGIKEIEIKYVAPTGLVPINTISEFAENKSIRSIASSAEKGILDVNSAARIATSEIRLINNYRNKINNISILGRTLVKDVTDTSNTQVDLENTFDANMVSPIKAHNLSEDKYKVYYSENGKASKDLNDLSNGWTETITDLSKVKSYLIVLENYEMDAASSIEFSYKMQIPEGLNYNEKVDSVYTVYFDNIKEEQTIKDNISARGATLTTGEAPKLETTITSYTSENSKVTEGQYVRFKATVKNIGSMDAENVKLNIVAPSGSIYYYIENGKAIFTDNLNGKEGALVATYKTKHTEFVEEDFISEYVDQEDANKTITIGSLKHGEQRQIEYELKVEEVSILTKNLPMENGKLLEPQIKIKVSADVISDKMQKAITSNEYSLELTEGKMNVIVSSDKSSDNVLTKGDTLTYKTQIENTMLDSNLKDLEISIKVPEGLKIKQSTSENKMESDESPKVQVSTNGSTVTFKVEEYSLADSIDFLVETQVENANGKIYPVVTAKAQNVEEHTGNIVLNTVQTLNFTIEQQKLDEEYFKEGVDITYTYKIKNNSPVYVESFVFENNIPDGTTFKKAQIIVQGKIQEITSIENNVLVIERNNFMPEEEMTVNLTVTTNRLQDGQTEKEIENYAVIYGDLLEKTESNHINSIVEYNKQAHEEYDKDTIIDDENNSNSDDDNTDNESKDDNGSGNNSGINGRYIISGTAWIDANKDGQRQDEEEKIAGLKVRLINKQNQTIVKDIDTGREKIVTTNNEGKYTFDNLQEGEYVVVFEHNSSKYGLTQYQKDGVSKLINSDAITMKMDIDQTTKTVAMTDTMTIKDSNIRNIDVGMYLAPKSDLSLEKYISKVTATYADTVKTYNYNNEKTVKVEIPGKNLSEATIVVEYKIVVTNEGDIANYVRKIVDYIPNDMKFNAELNKDWYQSTNGDLYNSSLANVRLQPGESRELTLTLTKKKTTDSSEIINNNAEIYEVYNEEGISDIDSIEANKISKEDDMSSADIVISIKTGEMVGIVGIISSLICIVITVVACVSYKKIRRIIYSMRRG